MTVVRPSPQRFKFDAASTARRTDATTAGSSSAGQTGFMWACVFGAVVAALGALIQLEVDDPGGAMVAAAICAITVLCAIFTADYRRGQNALSPICISTIYLFLLYPFHGLMEHDQINTIMRVGIDVDEWFTKGLLVFSLAIPFLWFGYRSNFGAKLARILPSPRFEIDDTHPSTRRKLLIIYGVALVARVIFYAAGLAFHWDAERSLMEFQFILSILVNLPIFVTAWFLATGLRTKSRFQISLGLVMLLGEFAWGLVSGSRLRMLLPIAAAVAAMSYLGKPMSVRRMLLILVVFALIVFPFTTAFRAAYFGRLDGVQRDGVEASTIMDALTDAANSEEDATDDGPLRVLAQRLHGLTSLALIIHHTPDRRDYLYGMPYLVIPAQILVPRALWSSKPEVSPFSADFHEFYWGQERGNNTSIAMTQLGDLWVNLHLFGVIAGTFIFGGVLAFLFRHLRYGVVNASHFPQLVFAVHLPQILQAYEVSFDFTMTGLPKSLLVYFIIAWILGRNRRAPSDDSLEPNRARPSHP